MVKYPKANFILGHPVDKLDLSIFKILSTISLESHGIKMENSLKSVQNWCLLCNLFIIQNIWIAFLQRKRKSIKKTFEQNSHQQLHEKFLSEKSSILYSKSTTHTKLSQSLSCLHFLIYVVFVFRSYYKVL